MRRVKIAMTCVSLLLAIMTLGYGVYAALQTKFKVESQINFVAVDVLVEVTKVNVYQANLQSETITRQSLIKSVTSGFYEGGFSEFGGQTDVSVDLGKLSFNAENEIMPYLIFEVYYTNHGENGIVVSLNKTNSILPSNVTYNNGVSATTTTIDGATVGNLVSTTEPGSAITNANNRAFIMILQLSDTMEAVSGSARLDVVFSKQ